MCAKKSKLFNSVLKKYAFLAITLIFLANIRGYLMSGDILFSENITNHMFIGAKKLFLKWSS